MSMSTILPKILTILPKSWQSFLARNAEAILVGLIICVVGGIIVATILSNTLWGVASSLLQEILTIAEIELPIYVLLLLLFLSTIVKNLLGRRNSQKYFWIEHGHVRWQANIKTRKIEPNPYCPDHPVKLVLRDGVGYYCPHNKNHITLSHVYDISQLRIEAQLLAESQTSIPPEHIRLLENLTSEKKNFVKVFFDNNTRTIRTPVGNMIAVDLRFDRILEVSPQKEKDGTFEFRLSDWAFELISKNPKYLEDKKK